ncbi:hypothetical protein [Fusibacter ferrireducens]|uniref:ABC transporter permease n=1 Tax=Fusibacter ferrireducens TaxID=2785058 RepID=A0ABR9ZSP5_9FIRM|nr:hypothetical protein [Fusibacter ferrireducens]MBF4692895.1 hypothetical protein [Fusibacter ferrireducens]
MSVKKQEHKLHALSIHMKYGEVLHIDDISKERKDNYLKLCTEFGTSIIVEDEDSVRNLLSQDVAKISVKEYSHEYRGYFFPIKKGLLSESTFGRRLYTIAIKLFVLFSVFIVLGFIGLKVVEGTIVDVMFDPDLLRALLNEMLSMIGKLFKYTFILMLLANLVDYALSYKAYYPVNQDGTEPVEITRVGNTAVVLVFALCYTIAVRIVSAVFLL